MLLRCLGNWLSSSADWIRHGRLDIVVSLLSMTAAPHTAVASMYYDILTAMTVI